MKNLNKTSSPCFLGSYQVDTEKHYRYSSNVHILREELSLQVFPFTSNETKKVLISGVDAEKATKLLSTIESSEHYGRICLFSTLNTLSRYLTYNGNVSFEILELDNSEYSLFSISSQKMFTIFNHILQWIPRKFRSDSKNLIAIKPKRLVWKLDMPKQLITTKRYRALLKSLSKLTELQPQNIPFNSHFFNRNVYWKNTKQYLYSELNEIGGTQRDTGLDWVNEYYLIYRFVKLNKARAIIREHIINEINNLLQTLCLDAKIEIRGLPSVQDIDNKLTQLKKGEISINEIIGATSI